MSLPKTVPKLPLCEHNNQIYIAWKGDGNDNLNVAAVVFQGPKITGFANKVVLGQTSQSSPALASFNGQLWVSWRGDGNNSLNTIYSTDNGRTFTGKSVSSDLSGNPTALYTVGRVLIIA